MKGKILKSKRIYLDQVNASDAKDLVQFFNETKHLLGAVTVPDMTEQDELVFIEKNNTEKNIYFFAVRLCDDDKIIGSISITQINTNDLIATTGTMIGLDYINQGYGTEAKHLLLCFAFNELGLRKIYSHVYAYNKQSLKYSFGCGYTEEAILREKKFYQGGYWDEYILSVTKKQWWRAYVVYQKKYLI